MKIESQSALPTQASDHRPTRPAETAKPDKASGHGKAVEVTLSDAAKQAGKSAESPAHLARAQDPTASGKAFGQLVSQLARGITTPAPTEPAPASPTTPASPVTETPVSEAPVAEVPVTEAPVTETPMTEVPVAQTPVAETPVTETPVAETPVAETPVAETPVAETPVAAAPATPSLLEMLEPEPSA